MAIVLYPGNPTLHPFEAFGHFLVNPFQFPRIFLSRKTTRKKNNIEDHERATWDMDIFFYLVGWNVRVSAKRLLETVDSRLIPIDFELIRSNIQALFFFK